MTDESWQGASGRCGRDAAARTRPILTPFALGFAVGLAIIVGLSPPSVQATPTAGPAHWGDPGQFRTDMFRDERRLIDASSTVPRGTGSPRFAELASGVVGTPAARLRRDTP